MRPIPHGEELPIPKPPEIGLLAMKALILTKITDNKKGTILMAIRHTKQVVHHLQLFLLTQENLNEDDPDLTVSKQQAELSSSRIKWWDILHQHTEMCCFHNRKNEFKKFFSKENDLVFFNDICSVL